MWGKNSKRILTCLYCNKWNTINVWHTGTQKHFSNKNGSNAISILYTGSHKSFLILIGEMFKVYFNILILH